MYQSMAITANRLVSNVPEELFCPCKILLLKPVVLNKCGHTFCLDCAKKSPRCVLCGIPHEDDYTINRSIQSVASKCEVTCKNHGDGCGKTAPVHDMYHHEHWCPMDYIRKKTKKSQCTHEEISVFAEGLNSNSVNAILSEMVLVEPILESDIPLDDIVGMKTLDQLIESQKMLEHFKESTTVIPLTTVVQPKVEHFICRASIAHWDAEIDPMCRLMDKYVQLKPVVKKTSTQTFLSLDESEDGKRRHFIANYIAYCYFGEDNEWHIKEEHIHRFAPKPDCIEAMKRFLEVHVSKYQVGLGSIAHAISSEKQLMSLLYSANYLPKLVYNHKQSEFRILKTNENCFTKTDRMEDKIIAAYETNLHRANELMHVCCDDRSSDGFTGGGTYASGTKDSLKTMIFVLFDSQFFLRFRKDNPSIQECPLLDVGAGCNRPAFYWNLYTGWRAHGIECNASRVLTASEFYARYYSGEEHKNIDVVIHLRNAKERLNLNGFVVFLLWDRAIVPEDYEEALKNIWRSITHDVILIVSATKHKSRKDILEDYFVIVEEGPQFTLKFQGSGVQDSLKYLRLKRRVGINNVVNPAPVDRLIDLGVNEEEYYDTRRRWHLSLAAELNAYQEKDKSARAETIRHRMSSKDVPMCKKARHG